MRKKGTDESLPKRALFIVNALGGGGAERVCVTLASCLSEKMEVDLVTIYNSNVEDYTIPKGVHSYSLGMKREALGIAKISQIFKAVLRLNEIVANCERKGEYCLITAHLTAAHVVASLSKIRNRCLYVHHSLISKLVNYVKAQYPLHYRLFYHQMYKNKKCIAVSNGVMDQLVGYFGVAPTNIITIYNPVDCSEVLFKAKEDVPFNKPYIVCVGRLEPGKRPDRMIQIFFEGKLYERFDLVFVGQGSLKSSLREQARASGHLSQVHFPGFSRNPYAWMSHSSVMVMTSDKESFANVVVEGIVSGARVVCGDCECGPREIMIGPYSQYLVSLDDIDAYIQTIELALSSYPNVTKQFIARFDTPSIAKQYLDFYYKTFMRRE